MFKDPFSFKGRIRRKEYALTILLYLVYIFGISVFAYQLNENLGLEEPYFIIFNYALFIPAYYFLLAQGAKRCHDLGKNGWYQIIPLYGFVMLFADGESEKNVYGEDPKSGIGLVVQDIKE